MAVIWAWLLNPHLGPFNYVLEMIGLEPFPFLTDRNTVIPSLALIAFWAGVGGNRMLIFLAGLQGVPEELYDAATIDGAGTWGRFWHVTLPMISPVVLFNLILAIIASLKVFTTAWVATQGGPAYATWFFALHIYFQAFQYFRLGYGSALAWVLATILICFTAFQLWSSRHWVHYEGERR
jgi:multiple sugar transport system permease protein